MTLLARRAVIVGTGLIGGSLAAAAKRAGIFGEVVGVGRGAENLAVARAAKIIDEAEHELSAAVVGADLVVLAAPIDAIVSAFAVLEAAVPDNCVITDVGSVKGAVVDAAEAHGLAARFVGAHPMAGGTDTGAAHAREALFDDATVALTPSSETEPRCLALVESMWAAVGARTSVMSAAEHDRAVAVISHLPQMLAVALAAAAGASGDRQRAAELASAGFLDTARLATSDPSMWRAIAALNRAPLLAALDSFSELLARVRSAVSDGDGDALESLMGEAREFYRQAGRR